MQIVLRKLVDYESVFIRFVPENKQGRIEKQAISWIREWEIERTKLTDTFQSSRLPLEYGIVSTEPDGSVILMVGWLNEGEIQVLEKFLSKHAKNVKLIEIGWIPMAKAEDTILEEIELVRVPDKTVTLEDGQSQRVKSFSISKRPVSFRGYSIFVNTTNYITTSERRGFNQTFRKNDFLPSQGKLGLESAPVTCVSYYDAIAYCEWANMRLPSEAEWLSAYVINWTEYNEDIPDEIWNRELSRSDALADPIPEWTGEYNPKNREALVRYGPQYFLEPGWRKIQNRKICPAEYTELCLGFRVCR